MKHIISFLVVSVFVLCFAPCSTGQENDEQLPEFFGVYAKMTDGRLIELRSVTASSYQSFEKRTAPPPRTLDDYSRLFQSNDLLSSLDALSSPGTLYVQGQPQQELKLSEVVGFYVYGNYAVDDFFLSIFQPPDITPNTVVLGKNNIRSGNSFIDTRRGWSLESSFRYVEKADKLYWVALREPLNTVDIREISFLAVTFHRGRYWPFSIGRQPYQQLLDAAASSYRNGEYDQVQQLVQESFAIKPSGKGYALLAKSIIGPWPDLGEVIAPEKISEASDLIDQALETFPANEDLAFLKADLESRGGDYSRSIKILVQLLLMWEAAGSLPEKVKTDYGEYPLFSLQAWNVAKSREKSRRSISSKELEGSVRMALVAIEVSETKNEEANSYLALAECYFAKGDWEKAKTACEEALRLKPSSRGAVLLEQRISVEREGSSRSARRRRR